jgi:transposase-like protein
MPNQCVIIVVSVHRKLGVDQEGFVLDVLVQSRRDKKAAKRLFRKLLKKQGRAPRVLITDKLRSYGAAKREVMPGVEHRQHKGLRGSSQDNTRSTESLGWRDFGEIQITRKQHF